MKIAFLVFDKLTALDAIGPYEVLSRIPEVDLRFVAQEPGEKRTDTGMLGITADAALADLPDPDILLVPGGEGNRALMEDAEVLDWLGTAHEGTTWTTSVCTGALVLAAAGLLEGKRATSHWAYRHELATFGAEPVAERVVVDGKIVTAAGDRRASTWRSIWSRSSTGPSSPAGSSSGSSTTRSHRSTPGRPRRPIPSSSSWSAPSPRRT